MLQFISYVCLELASGNPIIVADNQNLKIIDIAYYFSVTDWFWQNPVSDIYKIATQQDIMKHLLKREQLQVMPVNISPFALLILAPFSLAWRYGMQIGYFLWIFFNLNFFCLSLLMMMERVRRNYKNIFFPLFLVICLFLTSEAFFETIVSGQTSLLAISCLIFLTCYLLEIEVRQFDMFKIAGLMLVLAIKPQYALFGVAALVFFGRYKEILLFSFGLFVFSLVIYYRSSFDLFYSYLETLQLYSLVKLPDEYREIFADRVIYRMNIFSVAFRELIENSLLKKINLLMFFASSLFSFVLPYLINDKDKKGNFETRLLQLLVLISSYLLFSPHLGYYEEVFLFFAVVLSINSFPKNSKISEVGILFCLALFWLELNMHVYSIPIIISWSLKLVFIISLFWGIIKKPFKNPEKKSLG